MVKLLRLKSLGWGLSFLFSLGMTLGTVKYLNAATPSTAPAELQTLIKQIESAANQKDLKDLMVFYSPDFKNSDGLTYAGLEAGLTRLWQDYQTLSYTTTLKSWTQEGEQLVAETLTNIEGTGQVLGKPVKMLSKITSRQYFKDQKLVYQEIIDESTKITTGEQPPTVEVRLPNQVKVGQQFDFDVIVLEPLQDEILAGAVLNEKIDPQRYLSPSELNLELLSAGGVFIRVTAPTSPDKQWFSAIIVRSEGITLVTERLTVTP